MVRLRVMLVAVSMLVAAPAFGQGGAPDPGARQFATTCGGCHGLDGSGSAKGSAIAKLPAVIARSDDELIAIVHNGVPGKGMPPMAALGDDNIRAVVRYLRMLQGVSGTSPATKSNASIAATTGNSASVPNGSVTASQEATSAVPVDVQQSDLNQKEIRENWVSYNGDYSGRRFSSVNEVTPENVEPSCVEVAFSNCRRGRSGGDSGCCGGSDVCDSLQ